MNVPKTMSTQHPDNSFLPLFADEQQIHGETEIKEAFYAFSHLGINEQLWDAEGKEVDMFVVRKLFTNYEIYFKKNRLGEKKFITIRVPNPSVERQEAKILLETLESIPRSSDIANEFYGEEVSPIFEVALPMTSDAASLMRVLRLYKNHVVGKQNKTLFENDITIGDWVGKFTPEKINVVPLFEQKKAILESSNILQEYLTKEKVENYQRVWFGRSDPALHSGSVAAVLMIKYALQQMHKLEQSHSIPILPIIGAGSAPFRGNLTPHNVEDFIKNYPSNHTATIQSAFKYDYAPRHVMKAVETLNFAKRSTPTVIDENKCKILIDKIEADYQNWISQLAPLINRIAQHVPSRRRRKKHWGLSGYGRNTAGVELPRAVKFTAAMYSIGLPPEIIGMQNITGSERDTIEEMYPTLYTDILTAMQYYNKNNLNLLPEKIAEQYAQTAKIFNQESNSEHNEFTTKIVKNLGENDFTSLLDNITAASRIRRFLG